MLHLTSWTQTLPMMAYLLLHGDNAAANVSLPVQYAWGGTTKA